MAARRLTLPNGGMLHSRPRATDGHTNTAYRSGARDVSQSTSTLHRGDGCPAHCSTSRLPRMPVVVEALRVSSRLGLVLYAWRSFNSACMKKGVLRRYKRLEVLALAHTAVATMPESAPTPTHEPRPVQVSPLQVYLMRQMVPLPSTP